MTGNDFENVAYMAILVLVAVMCIDTMSAKLRRLLIGIEDKK
jgi:phosphonate transport system permease protein